MHTDALCWFLLVSLPDSAHLFEITATCQLFVRVFFCSCVVFFLFYFIKKSAFSQRKKLLKFKESTRISEGITFHSITRLFFLFIDTYLSAAEHFSAFCALH